jgi:hypothetical protein
MGQLDLAASERQRDSVRSCPRAEPGHQVPDVGIDRLLRDDELCCDLLAREAGREQLEDLALAVGKPVRTIGV